MKLVILMILVIPVTWARRHSNINIKTLKNGEKVSLGGSGGSGRVMGEWLGVGGIGVISFQRIFGL